jgi:DHA1 family multidrug resistance protein-like MFS transporter
MGETLRDSPIGQLTRFLSKNRLLQYPEERVDFVLPESYIHNLDSEKQDLAIDNSRSHPNLTADGHILVDWYGPKDPANPQNWSNGRQNFVCMIICLYTFVVYCGSAIYISSQQGLQEQFKVSTENSSLPLALYVLAYGMGPLIWAPLSEIPIVGRNPVYAVTFTLFLLISIPTSIVGNFGGLLVLRFLQGFLGSPCLANGAATLGDMFNFFRLPYGIALWTTAAYCGPALGPLLSGFAIMAKSWRWSLWEIVWMSSPVLVVMLLCLPETSTPTILLHRARRLRKLTGDKRILSQSEITQKNIKPVSFFVNSMIKPIEITIKDPAILFVNIYTSLVYAIYYSFFEAFPIVYTTYYSFNIGELGITFTCVIVGALIALAIYAIYVRWLVNPEVEKNGMRPQEHRLVPALFACFGPPGGLFLFAWTATPSIHWIVPTIGIVIYAGSVFIILQCIFMYVPMSYPQVSLRNLYLEVINFYQHIS